MDLLVLASEVTEKSLWYPTILGILVVVSAVGLFCGSVWLLLSTNLGARLGFQVALACLSGFLVLLALLWLTTGSPLNTLKGRPPALVAVESFEGDDFSRSELAPVQDLATEGTPVDEIDAADIKAAADAALVITDSDELGDEEIGATNEFAIYESATDYIVTAYYRAGGGGTIDVQAWPPEVSFHKPKFAVAVICPVDLEAQEVPFGDPIPEPQCDQSQPVQTLVFENDLGSLRVPPLVALIAFSILFGLTLLSLHWRERDLADAAAAADAEERPAPPVPVPT